MKSVISVCFMSMKFNCAFVVLLVKIFITAAVLAFMWIRCAHDV